MVRPVCLSVEAEEIDVRAVWKKDVGQMNAQSGCINAAANTKSQTSDISAMSASGQAATQLALISTINHLAVNSSKIDLRFIQHINRYLKDISVDNNKASKLAYFN